MPPRAPKSRPVKGVSANAKQTRKAADECVVVYGASYEEASNPESEFFDRHWYESGLIPEDDAWYDVVSDFLYRRDLYRKHFYKGKNFISKHKNEAIASKIGELLVEVEEYIRFKISGTELTVAMTRLAQDFERLKFSESGYKDRKEIASYDRGTRDKKTWYALYVQKGKSLGFDRPKVNRRLAAVLEEIKTGKRILPEGFQREWFIKMLHRDSTPKNPVLSLTYTKNCSVKLINSLVAKANTSKLPPVWSDIFRKVST